MCSANRGPWQPLILAPALAQAQVSRLALAPALAQAQVSLLALTQALAQAHDQDHLRLRPRLRIWLRLWPTHALAQDLAQALA